MIGLLLFGIGYPATGAFAEGDQADQFEITETELTNENDEKIEEVDAEKQVNAKFHLKMTGKQARENDGTSIKLAGTDSLTLLGEKQEFVPEIDGVKADSPKLSFETNTELNGYVLKWDKEDFEAITDDQEIDYEVTLPLKIQAISEDFKAEIEIEFSGLKDPVKFGTLAFKTLVEEKNVSKIESSADNSRSTSSSSSSSSSEKKTEETSDEDSDSDTDSNEGNLLERSSITNGLSFSSLVGQGRAYGLGGDGYTGSEHEDGIFPKSYWNDNDDNSDNQSSSADYRNYKGTDKFTEEDSLISSNNYLKYGSNGESDDPAFWLKKYAEPIEGSSNYKINLNVRGNSYDPQPDIEVALVIDNSNSMANDGSSKLEDAKKAAKDFIKEAWSTRAGQDHIKIGLASFETTAKERVGVISYSGNSSGRLEKAIDEIKTPTQEATTDPDAGGTNMQAGIRAGQKLLNTGNTAVKNMVFLGDGQPTFSYKTSAITNINSGDTHQIVSHEGIAVPEFATGDNRSPFRSTGFTKDIIGTGQDDLLNWQQRPVVNQRTIRTNSFAAISEAILAKNENVQIYGVGFDISNDTEENGDPNKNARYTLKNIVNDAENDYFPANNKEELEAIFKNIAAGLTKTIAGGKIEDPMGEGIIYDSDQQPDINIQIEDMDDEERIEEIKNEIQTNFADGTLSVSGLNLGKNEEVSISYKISVDETVSDGKFIQTNGKTTLQPRADSTDTAQFGVPSVRKETPETDDAAIHLRKTDADGKAINSSAEFSLYSSDKDGNKIGEAQKKGTTIDGNLTFDGLSEGYYLISETEAPEGFSKSDEDYLIHITWNKNDKTYTVEWLQGGNKTETITKEKPLIVKNKVNDFELKFKKTDDNKDSLQGAEFELKRLIDGNTEKVDLNKDENGYSFSATGLSPGEYLLTETKTPEGYKSIEDIKITIDESGKVNVEYSDTEDTGTITDVKPVLGTDKNIIKFNVVNEKEFQNGSLIKIDADDEKENPTLLAGAEFYVKAQSKTNASGSKVTYYAKATKIAPNKYEFDEWTTNKDAATKIVTSDEDKTELIGFPKAGHKFGITESDDVVDQYYLEETKAPDGYGKLTEDIKFEFATEKPQEIKNTKYTMPVTGGIGNLIIILVGLMVLASGMWLYRKKVR